jgi:hypothetical protein
MAELMPQQTWPKFVPGELGQVARPREMRLWSVQLGVAKRQRRLNLKQTLRNLTQISGILASLCRETQQRCTPF